jgi:hypothetical protein
MRQAFIMTPYLGTMRSKIKKIDIAMINTLQLTSRKNVIQMSLQW